MAGGHPGGEVPAKLHRLAARVLPGQAGGPVLRGAGVVGVLTTLLVWHLGTGQWARGLGLADYALRHGLALPDQYQRDLPTLLLDEVSEAAIKGYLAGVDAAVYLARVDLLTRERDAPDQARAKLHKAIGWALIGKTATHDVDPKDLPVDQCQLPLPHLQRAIELFAQVGVKKDVERLERRVKPDVPAT